MAGTPGAGKTEVSKRFLEKFTATPIRIDADDSRHKIPGYNGSNSHIIQPATALAVDKVLEKVFEKKYSFMLDGTFAICIYMETKSSVVVHKPCQGVAKLEKLPRAKDEIIAARDERIAELEVALVSK